MALRFQDVGRIGITLAFVAACSNDDGGNGGTAGGGGGGMVGAGTSSGGSSSGSASGGAAGSASGGTSGAATGGSAGAATGGSASGAAAGGSGGGGNAGSGGDGGNGGSAGSGGGNAGSGGSGGKSKTTFFVTSDTRTTGKLGSLEVSDKRCQDLAVAAAIGDHTFRAYLSTSAVDAKSRIGTGPWYNSKGVLIAQDLAALHSGNLKGDPTLFLDEKGQEIDGQWNGGNPNEHDILTGTNADGTKSTATCQDWTSDSSADKGQVGHSDGMGPGMATTGTYSSWNSAHAGGSCADTTVAGGKGRIYCFAID
jgi:hypothetical protein